MRLRRTAISAVTLALLIASPPLESWNQITHRQINFEATTVFFDRATAGTADKYRLGPLTTDGRTALHRGIAVTSSSMFVDPALGIAEPYAVGEGRYSMTAWITLGGDWADEPHLYASVRHFYDPLRLTGVAFLTDQFWAHGTYESPDIDEVTWALDHPDNPFSLYQGLVAYKLALETPEDVPPAPALAAESFRTAVTLVPATPAEQRSMYLARAYRALGEAMHMLGDMTQPSHVRNDSHPMDDPIEMGTFSENVRQAAADAIVDSRIRPFLASAGGSLQRPRVLAHQLALFTNRHLYSADTIHDKPSRTLPNNRMPPYPSPQFADLVVRKTMVRGFVGPREVAKLYGLFDGREIPLAQERLSFHWFDPGQSVFIDPLESFGRVTSRMGRYHLPAAFAREQSAVLMPVAIHGCADLMDLFFPTLELTAQYRVEGMTEPAGGGPPRQVVAIEPTMVHHRQRDPAWSAFDLEIRYTGPGTLVITRDGRVEATRKLHFKKGVLDTRENAVGKMVEEPLRVYVATGDGSLGEEEAFYAFEHGQRLHLEIEAGSRLFQSPPFALEHEVVIMPRRAVGPPGATFDFTASARPEGLYRFQWSWPGSGGTVVTEGSSSTVAPVLTEEGEHPFTVTLVHPDGTVLATDRVTASVEPDDEPLPTEAPAPEPDTGRWTLVRQWNEIWHDPRRKEHPITSAEAGAGSATIGVDVPDLSTTWHFAYAGSWSQPPASLAPGEPFEITLRLDRVEIPAPRIIWGVQLGFYDGWYEVDGGEPPPKPAGLMGHLRAPAASWEGLSMGGNTIDEKQPPFSTTFEASLSTYPDDGDVQVLTYRFFGQGAGSGGSGAAVYTYYEYRFQR